MSDKLFSSYRIGKNLISNRFTRSATAERVAGENGGVTEELFVIYGRLAAGKIGLVVTGHCYVHPSGKTNIHQSGMHDDSLIPGWTRLVEAFGEDNPDSALFVQLSHGGRQITPDVNPKPMAPSAVPVESMGSNPVAMTEEDIAMITDSFIKAAVRAKKIGFDGVQIHCAHGYLINQFLSPRTNLRKDKWGGSPENRMRFLTDIIKGIRGKVGEGYPIIVKINGADYIDKGLTVKDTKEIVSVIQDIGINAVEISGGVAETKPEYHTMRKHISDPSKEAYFLQDALEILKIAKIPVILAGGIRSTGVMDKLLDKGISSVSMSRPFIAEPDFAVKIKDGATKSRCVSCLWCHKPESRGLKCILTREDEDV